MSEISKRFTAVADAFARRVRDVPEERWESPSPCAGWVARDIVAHLVEWLPGPGFLLGTFEVSTGPIPPVEDDPAGAWAVVQRAIEAALDDPDTAHREEDCGPPGRLTLEAAVDMTCTPDVLIHTWDLARAAGLDERLDPDAVHRLLVGVESMSAAVDQAMRRGDHYGPRVTAADDADEQTRLLAFMGRQP